MKTTLLTILLTVLLKGAIAQNVFLGTKWNRDDLYSVRESIAQAIDSKYKLTGINVYDNKPSCYFEYTNESNHKIEFNFQQGIVDADIDMGKKGQAVIEQIFITGFYPDLYKVYKSMYNSNADIELIKTKGSADPIEIQKNVMVAFYRGTSNKPDGYWTLRIRKR